MKFARRIFESTVDLRFETYMPIPQLEILHQEGGGRAYAVSRFRDMKCPQKPCRTTAAEERDG